MQCASLIIGVNKQTRNTRQKGEAKCKMAVQIGAIGGEQRPINSNRRVAQRRVNSAIAHQMASL